MYINCIDNKITSLNGSLQSIIFQAIKYIYQKGNNTMTAKMVRDQCINLDDNIPWNKRIPAICNAMRNACECNGRIIGENKDFHDFTLVFESNSTSLETSSMKNYPKTDSNKKEKVIFLNNLFRTKQIETRNLKLSENFKIVMICAKKKNNSFFKKFPNENFVNKRINDCEHHPDEEIKEENISWRKYLENNQNDNNLLEAYRLYKRQEYYCLYHKFKNNFYILSAGWGLINSDFKLPKYDITFSENSELRVKRNDNLIEAPSYRDFNKLNITGEEDIIFIGSPGYIPLFIKLTQHLKNRKVIYWKKMTPKPVPERFKIPNDTFLFSFYKTNTRSSWYYALAKDFCNGIIP